jgi:hypothetical protein
LIGSISQLRRAEKIQRDDDPNVPIKTGIPDRDRKRSPYVSR